MDRGSSRGLHTVVLAAGKGTRLRSERSKMLIPVDGRALVAHVVGTALGLAGNEVVVVVGYQAKAVRAALEGEFHGSRLRFAMQREQRGTGDAVAAGLTAVRGRSGSVLVLSGDVPLIQRSTLSRLRRERERRGVDLAFLSMEPSDPGHYGRVVREGRQVSQVVEFLDADEDQRSIREVNAGIYCIDLGFLRQALQRLRTDNAKGEVYLTDLVAAAAARRGAVAIRVSPEEVQGVNTWAEQATLERQVRRALAERLMRGGVQVDAPDSLIAESGVRVAAGSRLGPGVTLTGRTVIGRGCRIEQGSILCDCRVGSGARVRPYCVLTGLVIPGEADVGPFVHLSTEEHHPLPDGIHPLRPRSGRGSRQRPRGGAGASSQERNK